MNKSKISILQQSSDPFISSLYSQLSSGQNICGDEGFRVDSNTVDSIIAHQYGQVLSNQIKSGTIPITVSQLKEHMQKKIVGDNVYNFKTGVGTFRDPSLYIQETYPVTMSPVELSAFYGNGGLGKTIIDKKSYSLVDAGITFSENKFWNYERIQPLYDTIQETSFINTLGDSLMNALLFGGSIIYPVLDGDTFHSYQSPLNFIKKGSIKRWVTIDRWNVCIVPDFEITAEQYMNPVSVYIPLSSIELHHSRFCKVASFKPPYLLALSNLGWAPSDVVSWITSYMGYLITVQSVPVMAQQMSLLLYKLPLDALNATIGPERVKELMQVNEEKMMEWSAVSPKAVNMVGEVEVVNRSYAGFEEFVGAMKSAVAAQAGVPEPLLWYTPNKGFSDNSTTAILKQSETLRTIQNQFLHSVRKMFDFLIATTYGQDSEEYQNKSTLVYRFSPTELPTGAELADMGIKYGQALNQLIITGLSFENAYKILQGFFPQSEGLITENDLKELNTTDDKSRTEDSQKPQNMW